MNKEILKMEVKKAARAAVKNAANSWTRQGDVLYQAIPELGMGSYYVKIGDGKEMMVTKDELMRILKMHGRESKKRG